MADVKWIKVATDLFDDEKILMIESMKDANATIMVWFKLLCLAGKSNNGGVFLVSDDIPYTDKMFASTFRMRESLVRNALGTFEKLGMIERVDGVVTIPNWSKHQSLDAYERKKERDRIYTAERRATQRAIIAHASDDSADGVVRQSADCKATPSPVVASLDKEEEKEREEDIFSGTQERVSPNDINRVIEAWNKLGLSQITRISGDSQRSTLLKARIREYGVDHVVRTISSMSGMPFLLGQNKTGWTVTMDWFVKPGNYQKIYEGNYLEKSKGSAQQECNSEMAQYVMGLKNRRNERKEISK